MRTTWRMSKINKSLWTCNDWVIYGQHQQQKKKCTEREREEERTQLWRRQRFLQLLKHQLHSAAKSLHEIKFLIRLLLLCTWFYSIVMTIDDFCLLLLLLLLLTLLLLRLPFIFFSFQWPCCIYGHWTENQSDDGDDEENWFRWKSSISSISGTIFLWFGHRSHITVAWNGAHCTQVVELLNASN